MLFIYKKHCCSILAYSSPLLLPISYAIFHKLQRSCSSAVFIFFLIISCTSFPSFIPHNIPIIFIFTSPLHNIHFRSFIFPSLFPATVSVPFRSSIPNIHFNLSISLIIFHFNIPSYPCLFANIHSRLHPSSSSPKLHVLFPFSNNKKIILPISYSFYKSLQIINTLKTATTAK